MQDTQAQTDGLLAEFCDEAMDLLQDLPDRLAQYAQTPTDSELINIVFRAVHTVKGNAGFFGLPVIKCFSHALEDTLDDIRQGIVEPTSDLMRCLIDGFDVLGEMLVEIQQGAMDATPDDKHDQLLEKIKSLSASSEASSEESKLLIAVRELATEIADAKISQSENWANRLQAIAKATSSPHDELPDEDGSPVVVELAPLELAKMRFKCVDLDVTGQVRPLLNVFDAVERDVFEKSDGEGFLQSLDELTEVVKQKGLGQLSNSLKAARDDFHTVFSSPLDMDAMMLSVVWDRLGPALTELCEQESTTPSDEETDDAPKKDEAKADTPQPAGKNRFLRVREERVDGFLEDVSSLFITCERLKDIQSRIAVQLQTHELVEELRQISTALASQSTVLQRSVVELRKVPVRGLFSKFPRVARTLASKLNKQIEVQLTGDEIEIDKSLVEDLDGPMMHMVRNVCDHGIETPEERLARGVPETGTLSLECTLNKTHVIITVADDGRGIDPDRLRKKVVDKGIYSAAQADAMSDAEAVDLIFHPGFSTAEQVSEISGRGVGLDVVRTRLREHNGDVYVTSKLGEGTTFRLEVPIRKAVIVIDGLLVKQADTTFVVPFDHTQEILTVDRSNISNVQGKAVARLRSGTYGAISLGEVLDLQQTDTGTSSSVEGVLINGETGTMLLLVESVVGQRKVVVSDLSDVLPGCDRISGVAQLGAGKLALVLNASELIRAAGKY